MKEYVGVDRRQTQGDREPDHFIVIKNWHTLIIVLTLLVSAVLAYASLRDDSAEYRRRLEILESRPQVSQESVDNLNRRLERMERKWDEQDLEHFRQMGDPRSKKK